MYLQKWPSELKAIVKACYPDYTGRTLQVRSGMPADIRSYWDGGSRSYYVFYHLRTQEALPVGSNHPVFERSASHKVGDCPADIILVERRIFCGKDLGIIIHCDPSILPKWLPAPPDLSADEKALLYFTRSLKSAYRRQEASRLGYFTQPGSWEATAQALQQKGLLRKNGAITADGRNAIEDIRYLKAKPV